ncbi:MAG: flagellar hook-length control protein FliK, partial [Gammaproteobacteria bacterium]|nr:flagellar hook-length control protein FliK [Gammaproteobacteria bacterium]
SDPQATGLLAQALAGIDKAGSARAASQLAGPEASNTFSLQLQPGTQDMSAQLGSRIRWMGNLNISSAELKLYPAELGTLEILITTEDDQARVNFVTSTTAAKEMIENSLPRLRELLGQSGMLLEQGDVTHRDLSKNSSDSATQVVEESTVESLQTEAPEQITPMYQRSASDHRIDHFA